MYNYSRYSHVIHMYNYSLLGTTIVVHCSTWCLSVLYLIKPCRSFGYLAALDPAATPHEPAYLELNC